MWAETDGRHFPDDIFKCIFLNEIVWIKTSQKFVPMGANNYIPALVQITAWRQPGDKPLSEPMLVTLPKHIGVILPKWVNSLTPRYMRWWTGPRFTNGFSIAIQIRWKFRFTLTSILIQWLLQNFVHGTTAVLSWHVQNFVAIWWPATELWQGEISIEFELRAKNR